MDHAGPLRLRSVSSVAIRAIRVQARPHETARQLACDPSVCARPGLNWRPPALQTGAPPTELQAQVLTRQRSGCGSRTHLAWRPRLMGPVSDTPVELPAGCAGRARTGDLRLMRATLFQLSHCAAIHIGADAARLYSAAARMTVSGGSSRRQPLVDLRGVEPLASAMQKRRSPN